MNNTITSVTLDTVTEEQANFIVCVFCDNYAGLSYCLTCGEYKGIMTLGEWLSYTGEEWVF